MTRFVRCITAFITVLAFLTCRVSANHIVGGELQMNRTESVNTFEIRLIQFWDTNNLTIPTQTQGGNRDESVDVYFYEKRTNQLLETLKVRLQTTGNIAYQNKACASSRSLNTSTGIYSGRITLNPQRYKDDGGYYIVWERCCRNADINNIVVPGDNGMVFYLEFPPLQIPDSSPAFVAPNGQYICANSPFIMNMGATDADGDELRYSLVVPMRGATTPDAPFGTSIPKSPYPLVEWESGISLANVIPGPSPLKIDNTGKLTVTANRTGLYVFAIQCEEYRNGKQIGLVRRDFQLLVIDCNNDLPTPPVIMHGTSEVKELVFCPEGPIELRTENSSDWSYQWQLNGLNIPGATAASMMVKDSGRYSVVKSYTKICSRDTTSLVVHVRHAPPIAAAISADAPVLCKGSTMFLHANGGALLSDQAISWTKDNVLSAEKDATMQISEPGSYIIEITNDIEGCHGRDTLVVAGENFTVRLPERKGMTEGSRATLSPFIQPANTSYAFQWSPPYNMLSGMDEQNALVAPLSDTVYTVTVTSANGCVQQASTLVYVIDKMHIPTAFSPDNDGHNDRFEIFNAKDQIVEMRIYNRWGELIHFSKGYTTPWDGQYKNAPAPAGSYPYVIKTFEREVTGTVMLLK